MTTPRERRLAKEKRAAALIESNHTELESLLVQVTDDIGGELLGITNFERDSRLAVEMAYRLDKGIAFPNPLFEALDWFIFYLASLGVIGIVRSVERTMRRKKERLSKLRKRIEYWDYGSYCHPQGRCCCEGAVQLRYRD